MDEVRTKKTEIIVPELEESQSNHRRFWTEYEEAVLRKYYGRAEPQKIADVLERTKTAVQNKAAKMGLKYGGE